MPTDRLENVKVNPEADTVADHNYNELYAAIGKLAEVDRLLIMLVLDELSYDEIADIMGINPGNLRVKIHRVKEKLKKIMSNE
jgi:RNA polymerase sigma-70 factor (ECF subfamily)